MVRFVRVTVFSVRHGLRIVALHGSADPTIGGAVSFPVSRLAGCHQPLPQSIDRFPRL
jgi:hypothetical protein